MTAEWWRPTNDPLHQDTFNSHPTITQSISSYFRRPSKITKPNSRNQSPRNQSRRRMTTHFPVRTRSVVDTQRNAATSQQQQLEAVSSARPLSWHPTFTNDFSQYQDPAQSSIHSYDQPSQYTAFAYGLVTPMTYPTQVEPYTDCVNIPLDRLTEQDYHYLQDDLTNTNYLHPSFDQDLPNYASLPAAPIETMEYTHLPWPSVPYMSNYGTATAPASPSYLPVPDMSQSLDFHEFYDAENEKEELVGMGLYDSPDQAQSSTLFSGYSPINRKSLKLEESFEPPPEDCDTEDAESESVEADEDQALQEELARSQMNRLNQQLQPNLDGSEKTFIYQNTEPCLVRDFSSLNYHENLGGNSTPYGWF